MLLLGLTGGIGSGKSTVSAALGERGAVVIDADAIVKELQSPGQVVLAEMVELLGEQILHPDGTLDRQAVADVVFVDPEKLKALGEIVHPRVHDELFARVAAQTETDNTVILDIPLLAESGWDGIAGIIVVDLDTDLAVERLVAFRDFDADDARARMANQASREDRVAKADFVVDNGGSIAELEAEIERCWAWIEGLRGAGADSPEGTVTPQS